MKIKSALVVAATAGALAAVTALFPLWSPLAPLIVLSGLMGAFAAWLVDNDASARQGWKGKKAA